MYKAWISSLGGTANRERETETGTETEKERELTQELSTQDHTTAEIFNFCVDNREVSLML
jgi:hypothetical protein